MNIRKLRTALISIILLVGSIFALPLTSTSQREGCYHVGEWENFLPGYLGVSIATYQNFQHKVYSDSDGTNTYIYYQQSSDYGKTWSVELEIGNSSDNCVCPKIAINGTSNLHVIYLDFNDNHVKYLNSTDNGDSFSQVRDVSGNYASCHDYPDIAVNGSQVHITHVDGAAGHIIYNQSVDDGATWLTNSKKLFLSNSINTAPTITVNGNYVAIIGTGAGGQLFFINSSLLILQD